MDLQNVEYRYGMLHPWLKLGSGVWLGLGLGLQLGVIDGICGVLRKKYWYWYWQYFSTVVLVLVSGILFAKVLVLVLAILFTSIVNNPD